MVDRVVSREDIDDPRNMRYSWRDAPLVGSGQGVGDGDGRGLIGLHHTEQQKRLHRLAVAGIVIVRQERHPRGQRS